MNMSCEIYRNPGEPWGFRLQGGADYRSQLGVKKVNADGPAARSLRANDEILTINNVPTKDMKHKEAEHMIRNSGDSISLTIRRGDDPLAHYRPDGPIKFNVQRAQQVQQAMGIGSAPPVIGGYSPAINGYAGPPPAVNGYAGPGTQPQTSFPWNAGVSMRNAPANNIQYNNYN